MKSYDFSQLWRPLHECGPAYSYKDPKTWLIHVLLDGHTVYVTGHPDEAATAISEIHDMIKAAMLLAGKS